MFGFMLGWRKASTWKRLIQRIECRLKLLNSKRCAIVRQVRDDLGLLLKVGRHDQTIFTRVEQLYMDEIIITVYELLGHFCQFISINLSCIRSHQKHCPNDVNEAISSLIFASARCGDVPELRNFRDLIQERYGHKFIRTALELLPGNHVNSQIKEQLSITSVSDDAKFRMVNEIYRDYCLQPTCLAIQYSQEWHQKQAKEDSISSNYSMIPDKQINCVNEMHRVEANSVSEDCFSLQSEVLANPFADNQAILSPAQDPIKVTAMENLARISNVLPSSSCSDVSVHVPDENVVYLDDVGEFRSPKLYDCSSPDTRVFMFKSSPLVNMQKDQTDHQSQMRGRLRRIKSRKMKMASSRESVNLGQDVEFMDVVYNKNHDSSEALRHEMHPRKVLRDVKEPFTGKRGKFQSDISSGVHLRDDIVRRTDYLKHHDQSRQMHYKYQPGPISEKERGISKPNEVIKKSEIHEAKACSPKSSNGSNSVASAPTNKNVALTCYVKDAETRYLRAFTLPAPQRPKDQGLEMYSRTSSLPVPPNHVHPKLPDCDQIEAKFSALKQVYQHTQCH